MATRRITTRSTASSSASLSSKTVRKIAPTVKSTKPRKSGTKPIIQRKVAQNDPMKPKKPPTAFFYFFLEDFPKEYKRKNSDSDVKAMHDIGKACGEKWKTMTYEEKVQYYDTATEKRVEFDMATADFIKRKERGEFDEGDSDSEFDA